MKPKMSLSSVVLGLFIVTPVWFFAAVAYAEVITFVWSHDELGTAGYKLYKSPDASNWTEESNIIGSSNKTVQYNKTGENVECFGVTAYSASGQESAMTITTDAGAQVCLGKPSQPTTFSFSVP